MTIESFITNSIRRDDGLVQYLCVDAGHIRVDLHNWIQDEVTALISSNDLREIMEVAGPLKGAIVATGKRLREINHIALPAANKRSQEVEEEIRMESGELGRSYTLLMQAQAELLQLLEELLRIREDITNIAD